MHCMQSVSVLLHYLPNSGKVNVVEAMHDNFFKHYFLAIEKAKKPYVSQYSIYLSGFWLLLIVFFALLV